MNILVAAFTSSENSINIFDMCILGPLFNRSLPIASVYCYEEEDLSSDSSAIAAM